MILSLGSLWKDCDSVWEKYDEFEESHGHQICED